MSQVGGTLVASYLPDTEERLLQSPALLLPHDDDDDAAALAVAEEAHSESKRHVNDPNTPLIENSNNSNKDEDEKEENVNGSHNQEEPVVDVDTVRIQRAEAYVSQENYLAAAALLQQVSAVERLQPQHERILKTAAAIESVLHELKWNQNDSNEPTEEGWKKQGETHGEYDSVIYYRIDTAETELTTTTTTTTTATAEDAEASKSHNNSTTNSHSVPRTNIITIRVECPIEPALLNPLISVLVESELYHTWLPSWKRPIRLGMESSKKLAERGRGGVDQVIGVTVNMPYPILTRECILHAIAADCIEDHQAIAVTVSSLQPDTVFYDEQNNPLCTIPPPAKGVVRVDVECSMLFQPCPENHPTKLHSNNKKNKNKNDNDNNDDRTILVSLVQKIDAHLTGVPVSMINFFTRVVFGRMWGSLLQVAMDIRDGKREEHAHAIAQKADLYEWIAGRTAVMLQLQQAQSQAQQS